MRRLTIAATLLAMMTVSSLTLESEARGRHYTITQRQVAEQHKITAGEKSGELTKKEADGLRGDMSDIASRIAKMKEKNGGKLSYKDEGKIEGDLNKVSVKIQKLELEKRVVSK